MMFKLDKEIGTEALISDDYEEHDLLPDNTTVNPG
jgi:hypothetical protein